jgi:hypothetical protein
MDLKADINITVDAEEVKRLIAESIKAQLGIEVSPDRIEVCYSGDYDSQEFSGVAVKLTLDEARQVKAPGTGPGASPSAPEGST